jgi:hypothetical protein
MISTPRLTRWLPAASPLGVTEPQAGSPVASRAARMQSMGFRKIGKRAKRAAEKAAAQKGDQ